MKHKLQFIPHRNRLRTLVVAMPWRPEHVNRLSLHLSFLAALMLIVGALSAQTVQLSTTTAISTGDGSSDLLQTFVCVNPPCTTNTTFGNFEVNAAVRAAGNYCDWFSSQQGTQQGVISDDFSSAIPAIDTVSFRLANAAAGRNLTYVQRMAVPPGTVVQTGCSGGSGFVVMLDAVAARDNHTAGSAVDQTIFAGTGDKNADNPATWSAGTSSVPQKNDIIDVGGHVRRVLDGTAPNLTPGDLYGYAFATTRNTNGDSHVDFEIFRTDPEVSGGSMINTGNDGGHTATKFAYLGGQLLLSQPGDLLVSVDYANGGTDPCASVWIWINPNNVDGLGMTLAQYNTGNNPIGTHTPLYEFTGAFYSGTNAAPYGYAEIIPYQNNINNCLIISTTNNNTSPLGAPWGNLTAQNAADIDNIQPLQLVEIAIDFTKFGLDLPDSLMINGPCKNILGSLLVKTRSSGSFTAELKDFAGPYLFGIKREANADAGSDKKLRCNITSVQLDGSSSTLGAIYDWQVVPGSGGNIVSGGNTANPTVDAAGCYVLKVTNPDYTMCIAQDTVCVHGQADITPPAITCPPAVTVHCADEIPAGASSFASFIAQGGSASDNYSGLKSISFSDSPLSDACGGSLTRTYTASDSCDNVATCTQIITVNDTTPPSITGPADQNLGCNPVIPNPNTALITGTDACSSVTVSHEGDVVAGSCNRTLTRTYRAKDACDNSTDWIQVYTYKVDTIGPVITYAAGCGTQVDLGCNASASDIETALGQATATDNCDATVQVVITDGPVIFEGCFRRITRTFSAKDACNNDAVSCTRSVKWKADLGVPSITLDPAPQLQQCNPSASEVEASLGTASVADVCGPVTLSQSDVNGGPACARFKTRTWTAVDSCGNQAQAVSRTVNWREDLTAPVITPTGIDTNLGCNPSQAAINAALGTASVSDNCDQNLQASINDNNGTSNGCERSRTRTFTVSDQCGNAAIQKSVTVTWKEDLIAPVIIASGTDTNLGCNPSVATIESALGTASISDNCDSNLPINSVDTDGPNSGCERSKTRTFTGVDQCGNNALSISVTVIWREDLIAPVITTTGVDTNLGCNPTTAEINAALGTASVSDNCDQNLQASINDNNGTSNGCERSRTRTFTVNDLCGNAASPKSVTVTWKEDLTPPVVTCNQGGNITVCEGSNVSLTPSATDNCDGQLQVTCTYNGGAVPQTFPVGVSTVSCSATDLCNNTGTCSVTITVIPNPTCTLIAPSPLPVAFSTGNILTATAGNTYGTTTYSWSVSGTGWSITGGQGTASIEYTAGIGVATFTLTITNTENGVSCSSTCDVSFESISPVYCSYTQGYYGNAGGNNCTGGNTTALLTAQLSPPHGDLILGSGANTLTFTLDDVSSGCIYRRLPGGGPSAAILGPNTCDVSDGIATKGNGQYRNVLLAQTITLGLNLRVPGSSLANLPITGPYLVTLETNGSGCNNPLSTPVAGTEIVRVIPDAVITYLGTDNTVGDLFTLANRVLGNDPTLTAPAPSLSAINQAVSAFNEGFDECRYFGGFYTSNPLDTASSTTTSRFLVENSNMQLEAYPNPAGESTQIEFVLNGFESEATLEVFTLQGVRIATLFNAPAEADMAYRTRFDVTHLPSGLYIYQLTTSKGVLKDKITIIR
ncbi:MAG: T9SS type A sorting domain-containing protein [Sphingobacteriales bacterium]|nr:T9SS type A sorting domain-containing protein [Sphingobacteriales bacterium]